MYKLKNKMQLIKYRKTFTYMHVLQEWNFINSVLMFP